MSNIITILVEQFLMYVPLLTGTYISFNLLGVPDFSIESAFVIGAIAATKFLPFLSNVPVVVQLLLVCLVSCLAGSIVGLISGSCTHYLRLNHALSAIITLGLFQGISYFILGAGHQSLAYANPLKVILVFTRSPELIALVFIIAFFVIALAALFASQLGYCFAAYGYNSQFFKYYAISSRYIFITGLMISNACAGLSGYLIAQSNGYIDISMGFGLPLMCLGALMLGTLLITSRRSPTFLIPVFGLSSYLVVQQLLLKLGFTSLYFSTAQALIILCGTVLRRSPRGLLFKS